MRFFLEVARARTASGAARRLGVDYTTVSRRIRALEQSLGALLFEKSRTSGFVMTVEGQRLVSHAETLESTLLVACEQVFGTTGGLAGHLRIGCTEAFGSCFITAQMSHFLVHYPHISADILPVPHFVNLSRREADIAITLERPERGPYVCSRLCDYRLRLYATPEYLANHPPIACREDLSGHPFVTYVEDLAFSFDGRAGPSPEARGERRTTGLCSSRLPVGGLRESGRRYPARSGRVGGSGSVPRRSTSSSELCARWTSGSTPIFPSTCRSSAAPTGWRSSSDTSSRSKPATSPSSVSWRTP